MTLKFVDWFAGVGGFRVAFESAGMECVWSCEIDEACRRVYAARFGHEPEGKDINEVKPEQIPDADIWCGGFPCQDLSVAGKRGGIKANRSGLVWRLLELAAVRKPHTILLENVPGLLSSQRGGDFALLLRGLQDLGYMGCYRVLDAQFTGVPQRRRRVFIVASLGAEVPLEILLEPEGGGRDLAARGEEGEGPSAGPGEGSEGSRGASRRIAGGELARSLGGVGGGQDFGANKGTLVKAPLGEVANAVTASTLRTCTSHRGDGTDNIIQQNVKVVDGGEGQEVLAFTQNQRNEVRDLRGRSGSLSAEPGMKQTTYVGVPQEPQAFYPRTCYVKEPSTFEPRYYGDREKAGGAPSPTPDITNCAKAGDSAPVVCYENHAQGQHNDDAAGMMMLRRLTPTECERLQGYEDGHTCTCGVRPDCPDRRIPPWIDASKIKMGGCGHSNCGCKCSDSSRYRQCGNSIAVPVVRWIADRMARILGK